MHTACWRRQASAAPARCYGGPEEKDVGWLQRSPLWAGPVPVGIYRSGTRNPILGNKLHRPGVWLGFQSTMFFHSGTGILVDVPNPRTLRSMPKVLYLLAGWQGNTA
jgi:hypothetical protein